MGIKPQMTVLAIWHEEIPASLTNAHSDSLVTMASAIICLNWRQPRDEECDLCEPPSTMVTSSSLSRIWPTLLLLLLPLPDGLSSM